MNKTIRNLSVLFAACAVLLSGVTSSATEKPKPEPSSARKLDLRIKSVGKGRVAVEIVNSGSKATTLVQPGDGSWSGWRTPIVAWSLISAGDKVSRHPPKPPVLKTARCKLINPLKRGDVVELAPGKTMKINSWIESPAFGRPPGKYRVVFFYHNSPELKWRGVPSGDHDPLTLKRLRTSTPCLLRSNEIQITVK